MLDHIPERDWKIFREVQRAALERYCQRVLVELTCMAGETTQTQHERYLAIYSRIHERNKELASAFDDISRSRAVFLLARMQSLDLVSEGEISRFSPEFRAELEEIRQIGQRLSKLNRQSES